MLHMPSADWLLNEASPQERLELGEKALIPIKVENFSPDEISKSAILEPYRDAFKDKYSHYTDAIEKQIELMESDTTVKVGEDPRAPFPAATIEKYQTLENDRQLEFADILPALKVQVDLSLLDTVEVALKHKADYPEGSVVAEARDLEGVIQAYEDAPLMFMRHGISIQNSHSMNREDRTEYPPLVTVDHDADYFEDYVAKLEDGKLAKTERQLRNERLDRVRAADGNLPDYLQKFKGLKEEAIEPLHTTAEGGPKNPLEEKYGSLDARTEIQFNTLEFLDARTGTSHLSNNIQGYTQQAMDQEPLHPYPKAAYTSGMERAFETAKTAVETINAHHGLEKGILLDKIHVMADLRERFAGSIYAGNRYAENIALAAHHAQEHATLSSDPETWQRHGTQTLAEQHQMLQEVIQEDLPISSNTIEEHRTQRQEDLPSGAKESLDTAVLQSHIFREILELSTDLKNLDESLYPPIIDEIVERSGRDGKTPFNKELLESMYKEHGRDIIDILAITHHDWKDTLKPAHAVDNWVTAGELYPGDPAAGEHWHECGDRMVNAFLQMEAGALAVGHADAFTAFKMKEL